MAAEREHAPMPEHLIERLADLLAAAIVADLRAHLQQEQPAAAEREKAEQPR